MESSKRIQTIDGLRAIAAVCVVFYHAILHFDPQLVETVIAPPVAMLQTKSAVLSKLVLTIVNGEYAVILFFLISGFVLQRSLEKFKKLDAVAAYNFLVRRVFRLMPLIFVTVTIQFLFLLASPAVTGVQSDMGPVNVHEYAKNMFLMDTKMLDVTWTIRIEMLAIPFIFAFSLLGRACGLVGTFLACVYALYATQNPGLTASVYLLHVGLFPFSVGMLFADKTLGKMLNDRGPITAILCIVIFLFSRFFVDAAQIAALTSQVLVGGILIGILANSGNSLIVRILEKTPMQFLGRISYSFYLDSAIVGTFLGFWSAPRAYALPNGLLLGVVTCLLAIPFAVLTERFVERPGIAAADWLLSRKHNMR